MKQTDINKLTDEILALNTDPQKVHEFICACANAKAITENKVQGEVQKQAIQIGIGNMLKVLNQ